MICANTSTMHRERRKIKGCVYPKGNLIKYIFISFVVFNFIVSGELIARDDDPQKALKHMETLLVPVREISRDQLHYLQTVARSDNLKAVVNKRIQLIRSVEKAILLVNQTNSYAGDESFNKAVLKYYNTLYSILREDYGRIVDLQKIAEESYDQMEAYLKAREEASEKLKEAFEELREAQKKFADDYNITLVEGKEDEITRKLRIAGEILDYYNKVFLLNFKNYKQEFYVIDAMNRSDLNAFEQNRQTLEEITENALDDYEDLEPYKGDSSLIQAYKENLNFYYQEAKKDFLIVSEYYLHQERFLSMKSAFDQKKASERTREEVDQYNESVKEMNKLSQEFNNTNRKLNSMRGRLIETWNKTMSDFLARHIPR